MLAVLLLTAAVAPPPVTTSAGAIAVWVQELGDDNFTRREEATRKLRAAGEAAETALDQALASKDAEVRSRAKSILAELKWGLYSDTPTAVAGLVRAYRAAAATDRPGVLRKMLAAGAPGYEAIRKVVWAEDNSDLLSRFFQQLAANRTRLAADLLDQGKAGELEAILELGLAANVANGALDYAAFHALNGQLSPRIAAWQGKAKRPLVAKTANQVLAYLHRAAGDLTKASAAASEATRLPLREALYYEQADWKALVKLRVPELRPTNIDDAASFAGYHIAFARLAGAEGVYQETVEALQKAAATPQARGQLLPYAKAMFLNGRADLGLDLFQKSDYSPKMVFEILAVQTRVKDALAVVESARKSGSADLALLEILEARTLHHLGEKEKALATLKKYTDEIKPGQDESWHQELVEAELFLDRREEAFAAAANILQATNDPVRASRLFDKLFDPNGDEALAVYRAIRRHETKEPVAKVITRLRGLVAGKGDAAGLVDALKLSDLDVTPEDWRAAGAACVWAKDTKRAAQCFLMANTARAWVRLGDLASEKNDWNKAAANYHAAYSLALKAETPPSEGLPVLALWLSGHALTNADQSAEGQKRMDRAHLLPLGDGEMRFEFVRALRKRGHKDAARREEEFLRRFGEPLLMEANSYFTGEGLRASAIEAANRKDWLRAADGYEQTFLRCLQRSMNFTRGSAYVTVPAHIYATRARGLMAADRIDEALVEAARALRSQPASVELAIRLVPELDRRGRKKVAEELYRQVRERYADVAKEYPNCGWARNQMAWLSACCRRDLDDALKSARRAIELSPDVASYHDTLAEVLFQMGKKDEAVAAQKKAIALQPGREEYQARLKRIEAGDPNAPRVEEDD